MQIVILKAKTDEVILPLVIFEEQIKKLMTILEHQLLLLTLNKERPCLIKLIICLTLNIV